MLEIYFVLQKIKQENSIQSPAATGSDIPGG